jgi:hypothetical protein
VLLTVASDDCLGGLQGDADLAEDVGGERVGNAEHAEQDVLVGERLPVGVGLLGDPAAVWIRRAGDVLDPSRRDRDEEEDVDPLEKRNGK